MNTYTEVTKDIQINVTPTYLERESLPEANQHIFVYKVVIQNNGSDTVQLLSRHWIITDGDGNVEEVKGPGVVGQQPILKPGDQHTYESVCPLQTRTGNMRGSFTMILKNSTSESGQQFDVKIPLFFLRADQLLH